MSEKRHVVKVTIMGDEFTIRSDASPDHTRRVAEYLDGVIQKVLDAQSRIETSKAAILAALQITDELFHEREAARTVDDAVHALNAEIRRWLPPAKRGESAEAASA